MQPTEKTPRPKASPLLQHNPLYKFKRANRLTGVELAESLGLSKDGVQRLMRYDRMPSPEVAERIGRLIGISQGEVIEQWYITRKGRAA